MNAVLEELLAAPELALWQERIAARLRAERVKREEFYRDVTPSAKVEFINGESVRHSPATVKHNQVRQHLAHLLATYAKAQRAGRVFDEKLLVSLTRNDYEPDIVFYGPDKAAALRPDQLHCPAPDWIVEVLSPGTEAKDRGVKFRDYAAHGIREYWLVDPETEAIEQYELADEAYVLRLESRSGTLRSLVLPEFEIPIRAVFDESANLAELRRLVGPADGLPSQNDPPASRRG
jgi:Uma2 family endonuclease